MNSVQKVSLVVVAGSLLLHTCRFLGHVDQSEVVESANLYVPSANSKPEVIQWLKMSHQVKDASSGESNVSFELKTKQEIWCERACSEFKLIDVSSKDLQQFVAEKKVIQGNTTPGGLTTKKDLQTTKKTIRFSHVGEKDYTVDFDVQSAEKRTFYAMPALVKVPAAGQELLVVELDGKIATLKPKSGVVLPSSKTITAPTTAFVWGFLEESLDSSGNPANVLEIAKMTIPWDED